MEKHLLAVLVDNSAGVLTRIASLFSRRGFNIESLAVGETQDPAISRITVIIPCDTRVLDQVIQQLQKLECVHSVSLLPSSASVRRELMLLKVRADASTRSEVMQIASVFRARVIDVGRESITLELTGENDKTQALLALMEDFGVLEMARTGSIALQRGPSTIYNYHKEEA